MAVTRQVILDTETTGLSPTEGHRIIEVGCLELINRRLTDNHFHRYINPMRAIERGAEDVHGITQAFLKDKPRFETIIDEFISYVDGAELIIHNAPFDVGFLNHEFQLAGRQYKQIADYCTVTDTLAMARKKFPGQRNSLDALCRRLHVDNSNRDLHGALIDSELLAQVYLLMTGGQTQLFSELDEPSDHSQKTVETTAHIKRDRHSSLPVIPLTPEEAAAHAEFMALLKKEDDSGEAW